MAASSISNEDELRRRIKDECSENATFSLKRTKYNNMRSKQIAQLGVCAGAGFVFGFVLEKGRVFEPEFIQGQMLFRKFVMLKMFLSAMASGMFSLGILSMLPVTQNMFSRTRREFVSCFINKGWMTSFWGAMILGSGMTLCGSCPGLVLAQVGAGVGNSGFTLAGGLFGVFIYGITETVSTNMLKPSKPFSIKQHFLSDILGSPFFTLALPISAMVGMAVFGVELLVPWTQEVKVSSGLQSLLTSHSWPPYVSGFTIGLLQIAIALSVNDTLGGSSSYCTLLSQLLMTNSLRRRFSYLSKYRLGVQNWWQVVYVGSAVVGGYVSSTLSGSFGSVSGVSPVSAFCGGFMMLFGARMAAGCTSGHGLSGMGFLATLSLIAVPAMFAGGIGTAVVLESLGYM